MSFKNYLGLHLTIQKFILLPKYQLPEGKSRIPIFGLRILFLFGISLCAIYDLSLIHLVGPTYIDVGDVATIVGFMEILFSRTNIFCLVVYAIFDNHFHIELLKMTIHFEKKLNNLTTKRTILKNDLKKYNDIILIFTWSVLCNIAFLLYRLSMCLSTATITWYLRVMIQDFLHNSTIFYIIDFFDLITKYSSVLERNLCNPANWHNIDIFNITYKLFQLIKKLEKTFNIIIFYYLMYHIFSTTFNFYFIMRRHIINVQMTVFRIFIIIFALIWFIRSIYFSFYLCFRCHKIHEKMEKLLQTLLHADFEIKSPKIRSAIQQIYMNRLHDKRKITVLGFYSIDLSAFTQFASSFVTFVLIIIQFKQLEDAQLNFTEYSNTRNKCLLLDYNNF
uniref:Gustatory receptor n=1 Tax=Phlebotomus papatasi TaxID=29031 RepID=A0A3F2ZEH7_PHLPP